MNERGEQLRRLLRAADPAREASELAAGEVARLRRTVLSAVDAEKRHWLARPSFAVAFAAATAAVVVGLALWRFGLTWKATATDERAATSVRPQTPTTHHGARAATTRETSPVGSAGVSAAATATPGSSSVPAGPATAERAAVASARRNTTSRGPRTGPRSSPRATHSPAAAAEPAPAETVAAAQPRNESQQPYQLQLTAPGGTRIVWLLTSSSGR